MTDLLPRRKGAKSPRLPAFSSAAAAPAQQICCASGKAVRSGAARVPTSWVKLRELLSFYRNGGAEQALPLQGRGYNGVVSMPNNQQPNQERDPRQAQPGRQGGGQNPGREDMNRPDRDQERPNPGERQRDKNRPQ
jgi:hypothetical protein